jgi:hypothetical protein
MEEVRTFSLDRVHRSTERGPIDVIQCDVCEGLTCRSGFSVVTGTTLEDGEFSDLEQHLTAKQRELLRV